MTAARKKRSNWKIAAEKYSASIGKSLLFAFLAFVSVTLILGSLRAIFVVIFGPDLDSNGSGTRGISQFWMTWLELTDPGTQAYDNKSDTSIKVFAVIAAALGVVLLSTVIAFLTNAIDSIRRAARSGRSAVTFEGHIVILGWNARLFDILTELDWSVEGKREEVVVLADIDKETMDEQLAVHTRELKKLSVTTRRGRPTDREDLSLVSCESASRILILQDQMRADSIGNFSNQDSASLMTLLTLVSDENLTCPIVMALNDERSSHLAMDIGGEKVQAICSRDFVARVLAQSSSGSGMSWVFRELVSFEGSELFIVPFDGEQPFHFSSLAQLAVGGIPVGIFDSAADFVISPSPDTVIYPGRDILVLGLSPDEFRWDGGGERSATARVGTGWRLTSEVKNLLIIGHTYELRALIREVDSYSAAGTTVSLIPRNQLGALEALAEDMNGQCQNLQIDVIDIDLDNLTSESSFSIDGFSDLFILGEPMTHLEVPDDTDVASLGILIRLLNYCNDNPRERPRILVEVLDTSNTHALVLAGADDVLASNKILSSVMAMVTRDPRMKPVFDDLLDEKGCEFYLRNAHGVIAQTAEMTFGMIRDAALQTGEIAVGFRRHRQRFDYQNNMGIYLNPPPHEACQFEQGDTVIVLAQDG